MFSLLIDIYLKQLGARSADDINRLTHPEEPREGDRYERAFSETLSFRSSADAHILREVCALLNGEGAGRQANPVRLPRPLRAGDIIVGLNTVAFLVTEEGLRALAFAPRGESYELTAEAAARGLSGKRKEFHPLPPPTEARPVVEGQP